MTEEQLTAVLTELRNVPGWARPCTREEIADFEARHGIELPRDYRRFLCEVGNGTLDGTVFPLGCTTYPVDGPFDDEIGDLAKPCRLIATPGYWDQGNDADASAGEHDDENEDDDEPDDDSDDDDDDEYWEALEKKWQDELLPLDGIFPFAYLGCTTYEYLVTAGAERGNVWEFEGGSLTEEWGPFCPAPNRLLRNISFIEWLCLHLKRADLLPGSR